MAAPEAQPAPPVLAARLASAIPTSPFGPASPGEPLGPGGPAGPAGPFAPVRANFAFRPCIAGGAPQSGRSSGFQRGRSRQPRPLALLRRYRLSAQMARLSQLRQPRPSVQPNRHRPLGQAVLQARAGRLRRRFRPRPGPNQAQQPRQAQFARNRPWLPAARPPPRAPARL